MDEITNLSHIQINNPSFDMHVSSSNFSLHQNDVSSPNNCKSYADKTFLERSSSDIDELRTSALDPIDKDRIICKSADCLLNDYENIKPMSDKKKQRSCDILDGKFKLSDKTDAGEQNKIRGHSRSKSASLMKETVVRQCKNHIKGDRSKPATPLENEGEVIPLIAINHYLTDGIQGKSHTLPKCNEISKMEPNRELFIDEKVKRLYKKSAKGKRKRDKITNMFSSVAGEKKEVIRYGSKCKHQIVIFCLKMVTSYSKELRL